MPKSKEIFVSHPTFLQRAFNFKIALVITILAFALLTLLAKQYAYFQSDLKITLLIQRINLPIFDLFMRWVTFLGNPETVVAILIIASVAVYLLKGRISSFFLIASTLGGLIVSLVFKALVSRPRPDPLLIHQVGTFLRNDSFPSGHVLGAVSLYGFILYIVYTRLHSNLIRFLMVLICLLIIFLMGLSRIYLGAHWFSDVLGAYLVGFIWLSIMVFCYHRTKVKNN